MSITCTNEEEGNPLECDYLVVGAGAASLAFVDTLLDELPDTKVIMIDRKKVPGGHWVDAYGFVRLHQPSRFYGIASEPLEGTPSNFAHRACKREILDYYEGFVDSKIASGNLEFYPECIYDFESGDEDPSDGEENDENVRIFRSLDGSESYRVNVNIKLVDGTKGECIIPHGTLMFYGKMQSVHLCLVLLSHEIIVFVCFFRFRFAVAIPGGRRGSSHDTQPDLRCL